MLLGPSEGPLSPAPISSLSELKSSAVTLAEDKPKSFIPVNHRLYPCTHFTDEQNKAQKG